MSKAETGKGALGGPQAIEWAVHLTIGVGRPLSDKEIAAARAFVGAALSQQTTANFISKEGSTEATVDTILSSYDWEEALEEGMSISLDTVGAAGVFPLEGDLIEGLAVPVALMERNKNHAPDTPAVTQPGMYYGHLVPPELARRSFTHIAARHADMQMELQTLLS